jgi:large subunit ribosomal protein L10
MKKEKQFLLDEIKNQIESSGSFITVQYTKVPANTANNFRREMEKIGNSFEVVKKRLFIKVLDTMGLKCDLSALPGHVGLVFARQDPIETTKAIVKFSKGNENSFALIGGRVDGQLIDVKDVERLSKLPSKDQMRAELLGLFEAPMAQTLSVMDGLVSSVVYCLANKADQAAQADQEAGASPSENA